MVDWLDDWVQLGWLDETISPLDTNSQLALEAREQISFRG